MKRFLFGAYFVAIAIMILLNSFGVIGYIPSFKVVAIMLIIPIFLNGLIRRGFSRMVFSLAFSVVLFMEELGMRNDPAIIGAIFASALFLSIGLNLMFPKRLKAVTNNFDYVKEPDIDNIKINSKLNNVIKYIDSKNFTSARINSLFSGTKIFFDKADINTSGAVIEVNIKGSSVELYVPKTWNVVDDVYCSCSGVKRVGDCIDAVNAPVLKLTGRAFMSGITINYI